VGPGGASRGYRHGDLQPGLHVNVAHPMASDQTRPGRWMLWGGFVLFWTVFGVFLAVPRVLFQTVGWTAALQVAVLDMYSWGLVALAAFAAARRFPLVSGRWGRLAALHLGIAVLVLLIRFYGAHEVVILAGWVPSRPSLQLLVQVLPFNFILYFGMLGAGYGIDHYRRFRERELESARLAAAAAALETQLLASRLHSLKAQLQPHFLFNTLNAISSLVKEDPERAERMITHLGDLLRATLEVGEKQEVTLGEEIELLQPYLEIERTRFGDRLTVELDVDPRALDTRIPHLLLQPLVENAIKHGIAPRAGPGRVELSVRLSGRRLRVRVSDDGRGFDANGQGTRTTGVGTANIRERLDRLYGGKHEFRSGNREGGGAEVEIVLPARWGSD